ncbi:hypothetical protein [Rhodopseudomonas sp. B29]|uniref:hypothetical protein n=1 Tax=Rhodopseudomonas sp. B29 TaxID=95607 RepID=UPI0003498EAF|nr:hypothetical protein [Rhodopseudomonas sp. B29]
MNVGDIIHAISVWSFRLAIAGGAVAIGYVYMTGDRDMPGTRMAASTASSPGTDEVAIGDCRPIGHTANDELVYSMDCESLPAATGGGE